MQDQKLSREERLAKVRPQRQMANKKMREVLSDEQKKKLDQYEQGPHQEMHGTLSGRQNRRLNSAVRRRTSFATATSRGSPKWRIAKCHIQTKRHSSWRMSACSRARRSGMRREDRSHPVTARNGAQQ